MSEKGLSGFWLCLLGSCFLVLPGLAHIPEPAECLVSGSYNLIRLPTRTSWLSCWQDCFAEPHCHMAVVTLSLDRSEQCLLVNCLKQGSFSHHRDPSARITVYPKSTLDDEQRKHFMTGYGLAEETFRCHDDMTYSSCRSGSPRFFYNGTSYRCERFLSGCGSSRNTFNSQEGCEALCNEKYRCYRPMDHGQRPPAPRSDYSPSDDDMSVHNFFFYNVSSWQCEGFHFRGSASNGNIFSTVDECQRLCGDVKASSTSQPAEDSGVSSPVTIEATASTTSQPAEDSGVSSPVTIEATGILNLVSLVTSILLLLAVIIIAVKYCRRSQSVPPDPSSISDTTQLLSDKDE